MNVLLLPYNIASDISHKVRALRSIGINARGLAFPSTEIQTATAVRPLENYTNDRASDRRRALKNLWTLYRHIRWADIVHWTCFLDILPRRLDERLLRSLGKPGVVQWYGSDIRNPDVERRINPFYASVFDNGYEYPAESAATSRANQRRFAALGFCPLEFPEMMHYVDDKLFPARFRTRQMVVLADHAPRFPDAASKRPVIVHSPSAPVAKGTRFILQAIEKLKARYDFEFVLVEKTAREKALEIMRGCDIFVDQLIVGGHGYAAVEAMAFGKPVVCYINPVTGKSYPPELPVVDANPENIAEKLEILLKDAALRSELGRKGRAYVEKYHDDEKVVKNLVDTYRQVISLHREKSNG